MYWDHMTGLGWTMMVFWTLIWVGLLGVVLWAASQWVRGGPQPPPTQQPPSKTANEILNERLARGEIDMDEYLRVLAALEQHSTSHA